MDKLQLIDRERAYWDTERLKITHPLRQLFRECTLNCNLPTNPFHPNQKQALITQ